MKYNIEDLKLKLLIKYPFWSSILTNVTYIEREDIPTADTDCNSVIRYNPNYLNSLNEKQQLFVLAHEVCHIAFNHFERGKGKDPYTWNIATDAVINDLLAKIDKFCLAPDVVQINDAILSDSEEIYEKIMNGDIDKNQIIGKRDSKGNIIGHASHDNWDSSNSNIENDFKNKYVNEKEFFQENQKMKKKLFKKMLEQLSEEASMQQDANNNKFEIDNLNTTSSVKLDWRTLLSNNSYCGEISSYSNSFIEDYVLTPGIIEDITPVTEILLDTSGSINRELLRLFLKECKKVLKYSKIKVGCFDTKFYGFKNIFSEKDIDDFVFHGGGGTDFDVAVNSFSHGNINRVIFTDGEADAPQRAVSALWIIYGKQVIYPKGAKVVNISLNDLKTSLIRKKVR